MKDKGYGKRKYNKRKSKSKSKSKNNFNDKVRKDLNKILNDSQSDVKTVKDIRDTFRSKPRELARLKEGKVRILDNMKRRQNKMKETFVDKERDIKEEIVSIITAVLPILKSGKSVANIGANANINTVDGHSVHDILANAQKDEGNMVNYLAMVFGRLPEYADKASSIPQYSRKMISSDLKMDIKEDLLGYVEYALEDLKDNNIHKKYGYGKKVDGLLKKVNKVKNKIDKEEAKMSNLAMGTADLSNTMGSSAALGMLQVVASIASKMLYTNYRKLASIKQLTGTNSSLDITSAIDKVIDLLDNTKSTVSLGSIFFGTAGTNTKSGNEALQAALKELVDKVRNQNKEIKRIMRLFNKGQMTSTIII